MNKLVIIKALLSKQVSRGCTAGEEEAAVAKAVELMGKYAVPHSAVASVWPKGWDFNGKRVVIFKQPKPDAHAAANAFINEVLRRTARPQPKPQPKPTSQGAPGTLGNYARDLLMRVYDSQPYSYGYILGRIMDRYPGSKTTVASLRWYENQMRKQGYNVPKKRPAKG